MSRFHDHFDQLPTQQYDQLRLFVEQFEDAWQQGGRPALEDFLPKGEPERSALLPVLAHIDLERRLKLGEPIRADDYLRRFPELAANPEVVKEMRATESKFRSPSPESLPSADSEKVRRLGGYRLQGKVGAGAMGVVYLAEDEQLGRPVALKVMQPALAANPSARVRFLREARAMAKVKHPNIVTIYQVGEEAHTPFLAMEFLKGESLDGRLKREWRLTPVEVLRLGQEIAAGLAAAHEVGLIHRDIKPANIWLETSPREQKFVVSCPDVKILDFGLARAAQSDDTRVTDSGIIVGTPAYMSPEQARASSLNARSDLFSLGCLLYRASTGREPFIGADAISTLLAVTSEQPVPPQKLNAEIPHALAELIVQLLAKDPVGRPASAQEVANRLRAIEQQIAKDAQTSTSELPKAMTKPVRPPRKWKLAVLAGSGALLLVLSLGFFFRDSLFPPPIKEDNKTEPDLSKKTDVPAASDDRKAAEWVLSLGGDVIVRNGKDSRHVYKKAELLEGKLELEFVNLHGRPVKDAGLANLKDRNQLWDLLIGGTQITDSGLEHLKGLVNLRRLSLNSTRVGNAGLQRLKPLIHLKTLELSFTSVTDAGLEHLQNMSGLQKLDLTNTKVTFKGLTQLRKSLPKCRILSSLNE